LMINDTPNVALKTRSTAISTSLLRPRQCTA
jgi:hypothetical protein